MIIQKERGVQMKGAFFRIGKSSMPLIIIKCIKEAKLEEEKMKRRNIRKLQSSLILVSIIILTPIIYQAIESFGHNAERVKEKIEAYLYNEYGEEFVADRVGTRNYPDGKTRFIARIYPESIIGTNKEGDPYYTATAGVEKKIFGRLGAVGAGYENVLIKLEAEEYINKKAKELFGERVLIKTDVKYKLRKKGNSYFSWQIVSGFEELLERVNNDPNNHRIEMDLYIYIFDRIETEEEKEERRRQIFDFIQYLKEEGLFEHLEMGVIFIDERVLAPGYIDYYYKINRSEKVKEEIAGETVYLPPLELRKEMSEVLQKEVDRMSEEEMVENMGKIRKNELTPEHIANYNRQYLVWICSLNMLKETRSSRYERERKEDNLDFYQYEDSNNIIFAKDHKYIFE